MFSAPPVWPGYAPWADTVTACRREFERVARSFWLIPELIPQRARDDVALLYCFCRRLDDAVDEAPEPTRAAALAQWRDELRGRVTPRPLIAAFLAGAPRSGLPLACAEHLLDGMQSDLGPVRMADDAALLRYAYQVSSAVGLMLAPLLGVAGSDAQRRVVDLGLALQLSNVLLGVADDARRGRVYLPEDRLRSAGLTSEGVLAQPSQPHLRRVLRGVAALAERYYQSAQHGAAHVPWRYRHGVILLGRAYARLGRRAAAGRRAPAAPAGLPLLLKAFHLVELGALAWHPRVIGLLPPRRHDPQLHRALPAAWPGVAR